MLRVPLALHKKGDTVEYKGESYHVNDVHEDQEAIDRLNKSERDNDYVRMGKSRSPRQFDGPPGYLLQKKGSQFTTRVPLTEMHPTWKLADWVIPGPWDEALAQLQADHWKATLM